jgi:hypothetical protein
LGDINLAAANQMLYWLEQMGYTFQQAKAMQGQLGDNELIMELQDDLSNLFLQFNTVRGILRNRVIEASGQPG